MEPRRTRRGAQFSPWESFASLDPVTLAASGFQVHQTDVSLEELIAAAEEAADAHAEAELDLEDDGSDWEELNSCPPSPDSDSSADPSQPATPLVMTEDLPDPDMPPLIARDAPRSAQAARNAQYHKDRCKRKRQQQASSPFTCAPHPKSIPTHRMLPPKKTNFDARDLATSNGGHWLGKRQPQPRPKTKNKKKNARERAKAQRLRELKELIGELEYQYLRWDGK